VVSLAIWLAAALFVVYVAVMLFLWGAMLVAAGIRMVIALVDHLKALCLCVMDSCLDIPVRMSRLPSLLAKCMRLGGR
jgi:hypothetical protein